MYRYLLLSLFVNSQTTTTNGTRSNASPTPFDASFKAKDSGFDPLPLVLGLVAVALILLGALIYYVHYRFDPAMTPKSQESNENEYSRKKMNLNELFKTGVFNNPENSSGPLISSPNHRGQTPMQSQVGDFRQASNDPMLSILRGNNNSEVSGPPQFAQTRSQPAAQLFSILTGRQPMTTQPVAKPARKLSILTGNDEALVKKPVTLSPPRKFSILSGGDVVVAPKPVAPVRKLSILQSDEVVQQVVQPTQEQKPNLVQKIFNRSPSISNAPLAQNQGYSTQAVSVLGANNLEVINESNSNQTRPSIVQKLFHKSPAINTSSPPQSFVQNRRPSARKNSILTNEEEPKPVLNAIPEPVRAAAPVKIDLGFTPYMDFEEDDSPFVPQVGWKPRDIHQMEASNDDMKREPPHPSVKQAHKSNYVDLGAVSQQEIVHKYQRSKSLADTQVPVVVPNFKYGRDENGYPVKKSPEKPKHAPPPPPVSRTEKTFSQFMSQFDD